MRDREKTVKFAGIRAVVRGKSLDFSEALEMPAVVPAKYEVCESCEGSGTTTAHIEPEGGGFTSSEWHEMEAGDPDFAEDYFSGKYDRPCEECKGARVVLTPIEEEADPAVMAALWEQVKAETAYQAEVAHQRRYGY